MRVLILGGTREARDLAGALVDTTLADELGGVTVTTSLAGRVRDPALPAGETVIGGFGGVAGLRTFLRERRIDVVVDATHPFAATMSRHAVAACAGLAPDQARDDLDDAQDGDGDGARGEDIAGAGAGPRRGRPVGAVPLLRLARPGWTAQPGDDWHRVPDLAAAAERARALCPVGRGVFVTTGRRQLAPFATDPDRHYVVRAVDPPTDTLPPWHTVLLDRGPYTLDGETRILREHDVRAVVSKDSGGALTVAKLAAARALRLPVVLVDRPARPEPHPPACPDVAGILRALRTLPDLPAGTPSGT